MTLLGFLNYGTMTGYDLKGYMDASTQGVWHASLSQIYPTLHTLEKEGLVTSTMVPQAGKPDRKYYEITKAGKEIFLEWLDQNTLTLAHQKNVNMLRLFFAGSLSQNRILHHLQTELDLQRQQLAVYEADAKSYIEDIVKKTGLSREAVMWRAIRKLGIVSKKTTIRWLETTIEQIDESDND